MLDPDTLFGMSLIEGFISRPTGDRQLVRGYDVLIELVCFTHEDKYIRCYSLIPFVANKMECL